MLSSRFLSPYFEVLSIAKNIVGGLFFLTYQFHNHLYVCAPYQSLPLDFHHATRLLTPYFLFFLFIICQPVKLRLEAG